MKSSTDFMVIGSGIAGLMFALHASRYGSVVLMTKKHDSESNSNYAQGGIACVLDYGDSYESHVTDTLTTGKGLCNEHAVQILVHEGPACLAELLTLGVSFSKDTKARNPYGLHLGKEGGHSRNRIVHAKDLTGREVEQALIHAVRSNKAITLLEEHCAVELITNHHISKSTRKSATDTNRVYGAYVLDKSNRKIQAVLAKVTCLATGGVGQVYLHTTNPSIATGDGIAMAWRAGASIANMEFIQFHPTTLYHEKANSFLISEALRGFGAVLVDARGDQFMRKYHKLGSLAPRDVVAQAIDKEMKVTGEPCVFLDIRHEDPKKTRAHFPHIYKRCKMFGIDITRDLIPVVPAAHYLCGGIAVNEFGASSLAGLYACGEVSSTGVHGANRLASNSLLEALVFSRRAADDACIQLRQGDHRLNAKAILPWNDQGTTDAEEWVLLSHNVRELQSVMWDYVGIVRSDLRLARAIRRVNFLQKEIEDYYKRTTITMELLDLRNIVATARLIIESAQKRHESRGLHFTTDYPSQDDAHWKRDTVLVKRQAR